MDDQKEFIRFMEHMEKGLKKEAPTLKREEMLAAIAFGLWHENRRTTPDRDSIIEECAKVCDDRAHRGDTARGGMGQVFADTQDEEARNCAAAIRKLKTAPTSDQGVKA